MEQGPTTRQRRLAAELRRLREAAELTPEQAAGVLGWSRPKLVKIELAKVLPKPSEVERILGAYGGTNEAVKLALMQLARDSRQRGWWAAYGDVLAGSYAELEDAASVIRSWQTQLIPGLLQNEDYARVVVAGEVPDDPAEVDRRVQARMTRRTLLSRGEPPALHVVLAEEVLRRPIGGVDVRRAQARDLLAATDRSQVTIQIVPTEIGHHPGIGQGSLVLFEFPGPVDLGVAYLETMAGGMYVEDVTQVRRCTVKFNRIADAALSAEDSAALIAAVAKE